MNKESLARLYHILKEVGNGLAGRRHVDFKPEIRLN